MPLAPNPPAPLPPLPRTITGLYVTNVMWTACPGYYALAWLDAEPAQNGTDFEFVNALPPTCPHPGEPLPAMFRRYFAQGIREAMEARGRGRSPYATRIVLRDAVWDEINSNPWSFEAAGRHAASEILDCVWEEREPRRAGRNARPELPIPPMPRARPPRDGTGPSREDGVSAG